MVGLFVHIGTASQGMKEDFVPINAVKEKK